MFPSTVMAYFQLEGYNRGYNIIWFSIYKLDPTPRLAHHYVLAHWLIDFFSGGPHPPSPTPPLPRFNVATPTFQCACMKTLLPCPHFRVTLLHAHKILIIIIFHYQILTVIYEWLCT
jgi:hypothetical protein